VVNYPGFAEISGGELAEKMLNHCRKLGATIHDIEPVVGMDSQQKPKRKTSRATYQAKTVIICQGSHYKESAPKAKWSSKAEG